MLDERKKTWLVNPGGFLGSISTSVRVEANNTDVDTGLPSDERRKDGELPQPKWGR